ncbi:MAG: transcription antitermination factor NusB [Bacillota bacterium]|nr:transcription antitermination factor NusB [Bacillota bacterium]
MNRRYSREHGMKLLFGLDFSDGSPEEMLENYIENNQIDMEKIDMEYLKDIINGVTENKGEIDKAIEKNLSNWKIERISKVDLAILRLCVYEILYKNDIPNKVSVNEAINLSKKYSGAKSPSFINGVLGKFFEKE